MSDHQLSASKNLAKDPAIMMPDQASGTNEVDSGGKSLIISS